MAIGTGAAILGSAVIGAGASMLGSSEQAGGYGAAAALQAQAQMEAIDENRRQFNLMREDLAPYRETGVTALEELGRLYGVGRDGLLSEDDMTMARERFMATPGYDFRYSEGLKALDRSAAARGGLRGGAHSKDLLAYGQGMATAEFGNYANRLASLAGVGQSATNTGVAAGGQISGNISNAMLSGAQMQGASLAGAATARASGYTGAANALGGAVNNFVLLEALKNAGGPIG